MSWIICAYFDQDIHERIQKVLSEGSNSDNVFSSPELKAREELIGLDSSRRPCVHTFKHEYPQNQPADRNQISSEASLGWGIGCIRFCARSD